MTGCKELTLAHTVAQRPPRPPPTLATVTDVMRPPLTTPRGILTEAEIAHAVADGENLDQLRIRELMTLRPTVINPATSVHGAAQIMTRSHFRHLPVCGDSGLARIIDITDICRALLALASAERKERKRS